MPPHLTASQPLRTLRPPAARSLLLSFIIFIAASPAFAQTQTLPDYKPQGYVNDFANVLSPSTREQLTALCKEVDEKAHAQIAVVTVPSTNGQPIVDYSFNLATKWGVGPKQSNRGVMILFAVNDHKYWIQVGYGLEPILPDGKVGSFGREAVPILRQGNYDAAALLITRRVADVIAQDAAVTLSGEPPRPPRRAQPQEHVLSGRATLFLILFVIGIIYLMMKSGGSSSGRGGWGGGGGAFGGGGAGGSW